MATRTPDSTIERTETRRTISPYDLTAADNPGAVISYPLLKGSKYDEWAISFKTTLSSRKKFGFLDGSITKPSSDSPDFEDWEPVNALLVSWIKMTIHESLWSNISHCEVAKDLWDHLKKRFSVSSGPKYQQVKAELAECKQLGQSIETYFGRLTKIWDALATLRPLRPCTCLSQQEKDREEDRVQDLLYGVDDSFHSIRSTLIFRIPLPSVEETYNLLRQEEDLQKHNKHRDAKPEVLAFAVQAHQKSRDERDKGAICTHCKRTGHTASQCFNLIGYPEWWGERSKYRGNTRSRDKTVSSSPSQRAVANAVNSHAPGASPPITNTDRDGVSGLSE